MLQALLAYLLAACGEEHDAVIPAHEIVERFHIPRGPARGAPAAPEPRQLRRRLLHGLRRARRATGPRRQGALRRHFQTRPAPDTARGARDPPRARVRRPDDRRGRAHAARPCAREARGDLRPVRARADAASRAPRTPKPTSSRRCTEGIRERRLVEIEYQKEGEQTWSQRIVEPYSLERELPNWRVHTWDRTRDAERSFRLDRMRSAKVDGRDVRAAAGVRAPRPARRPHAPRCSTPRASPPAGRPSAGRRR